MRPMKTIGIWRSGLKPSIMYWGRGRTKKETAYVTTARKLTGTIRLRGRHQCGCQRHKKKATSALIIPVADKSCRESQIRLLAANKAVNTTIQPAARTFPRDTIKAATRQAARYAICMDLYEINVRSPLNTSMLRAQTQCDQETKDCQGATNNFAPETPHRDPLILAGTTRPACSPVPASVEMAPVKRYSL